jgi:hypothetical protein
MASLGRDPGIEAIGEKPDKFQKKVRGLLPLVSLTHYPPERLPQEILNEGRMPI